MLNIMFRIYHSRAPLLINPTGQKSIASVLILLQQLKLDLSTIAPNNTVSTHISKQRGGCCWPQSWPFVICCSHLGWCQGRATGQLPTHRADHHWAHWLNLVKNKVIGQRQQTWLLEDGPWRAGPCPTQCIYMHTSLLSFVQVIGLSET